MGHTVRVWVGLSSDWVMFVLNDISGRFGLSRVWFGSGRVRVNQFLVKYTRHAKRSNFVKNFESGIIRFGSIRISGPLSGEHISGVGSVWVRVVRFQISGLGSVLSGLVRTSVDDATPKKVKALLKNHRVFLKAISSSRLTFKCYSGVHSLVFWWWKSLFEIDGPSFARLMICIWSN